MTKKLPTLFLLSVAAAAFSGYMFGKSSVPGVSARTDTRASALREPEEVDANSACADLRRELASERAKSDTLETERDALREERDALKADVTAGSGQAPVSAEVAKRKLAKREQRKKRLLRGWNKIVGDPLLDGKLPDYRRRGMFAELYADLRKERTPEEIRRLYEAFLIGYRPYRRAKDDFDARAPSIRDAVELRRESENLAKLQRGLYAQVLPLLNDDERRAFK